MTPRRCILGTLTLCLLLLCIVEGAAALAVTISPDSIGSGGTVTVDISDLPDGSTFALRTESEIPPDGQNSFVFDMTDVTMPFTLTDPDIRIRAEPVERAGVRVQTGGTAKSVEALGQNGIVDLVVGYSAISAPLDLVRVSGEAMEGSETVVLATEISGEASGVDDAAITFGIAGISEGSVQVSVLVDGSDVATKRIVVEGAAPLTIESSKESVVYGKAFAVTVTGEPDAVYSLYVNDAGLASADQYPLVAPGQPGVVIGTAIPVAGVLDFPYTKANLTTTAAGTRTVVFNTSFATEPRSFTITVVDPADPSVSDAATVQVEMGTIFLTASGTGVYYVGEEIIFCGDNTDNATTYLFLTGPDLPVDGVRLDNISAAVVDGQGSTFTRVNVGINDAFEYRWNSSILSNLLATRVYTVYAVSTPRDKAHLSSALYATTTVVMKRGTVSATTSPGVFARGDTLTISGTVTGYPENVSVWFFSEGSYIPGRPAKVAGDGSFVCLLGSSDTLKLSTGQCFAVVQYPGGDGRQDVVPINETWIRDAAGKAIDLRTAWPGDAADALASAINASNTDSCAQVAFVMKEEAPWIGIDAIGDKTVGSIFTITGTTNLAAGDELLVNVTDASSTSLFCGEAVVKYVYGDSDNTWSLPIDTTGFAEGEYTVTVGYPELETDRTTTFTLVPPDLVVSAPAAYPAVIPQDTDGSPGWGETSVLSVTVTGAGIASVTVDLSAIGGPSAVAMAGTGDGIWTANVTASAPSPFADGAYQPVLLPVNATNTDGISNTSVSIPLTVVKNGDANQDGRVTLYDAVYTARHYFGTEGYPMTESIGMVSGGSSLSLVDAMYLARHILGMPGYEALH